MLIKLYSIFDSKTAVFGTPFVQQSDAAATRMFGEMVNDPRAELLHRHPEDFVLHQIGEFDDELGTISGVLPVAIATAASLVKRVPQIPADYAQQLIDAKIATDVPMSHVNGEEVKQ